MARFSINQPLKGIEIYFEDRPSADVLSELKAIDGAGFILKNAGIIRIHR